MYPWAILIEMSRYRDITLKEVHVESEASRTINYVVNGHKAADFLSCVELRGIRPLAGGITCLELMNVVDKQRRPLPMTTAWRIVRRLIDSPLQP